MESGHSRLLNCVAAGTLKIPVSPADAFKPTLHPSFLLNYGILKCPRISTAKAGKLISGRLNVSQNKWLESLMRGS